VRWLIQSSQARSSLVLSTSDHLVVLGVHHAHDDRKLTAVEVWLRDVEADPILRRVLESAAAPCLRSLLGIKVVVQWFANGLQKRPRGSVGGSPCRIKMQVTSTCGRGGIGRRARFRSWSRKGWRFKSSRPHCCVSGPFWRRPYYRRFDTTRSWGHRDRRQGAPALASSHAISNRVVTRPRRTALTNGDTRIAAALTLSRVIVWATLAAAYARFASLTRSTSSLLKYKTPTTGRRTAWLPIDLSFPGLPSPSILLLQRPFSLTCSHPTSIITWKRPLECCARADGSSRPTC
jgi:hypothetical protein